MDQQDRDAGQQAVPGAPAQESQKAEESANDSTWGVGSASALDNLRRHDFRVRRSKAVEEERPQSE